MEAATTMESSRRYKSVVAVSRTEVLRNKKYLWGHGEMYPAGGEEELFIINYFEKSPLKLEKKCSLSLVACNPDHKKSPLSPRLLGAGKSTKKASSPPSSKCRIPPCFGVSAISFDLEYLVEIAAAISCLPIELGEAALGARARPVSIMQASQKTPTHQKDPSKSIGRNNEILK